MNRDSWIETKRIHQDGHFEFELLPAFPVHAGSCQILSCLLFGKKGLEDPPKPPIYTRKTCFFRGLPIRASMSPLWGATTLCKTCFFRGLIFPRPIFRVPFEEAGLKSSTGNLIASQAQSVATTIGTKKTKKKQGGRERWFGCCILGVAFCAWKCCILSLGVPMAASICVKFAKPKPLRFVHFLCIDDCHYFFFEHWWQMAWTTKTKNKSRLWDVFWVSRFPPSNSRLERPPASLAGAWDWYSTFKARVRPSMATYPTNPTWDTETPRPEGNHDNHDGSRHFPWKKWQQLQQWQQGSSLVDLLWSDPLSSGPVECNTDRW